MAKQVLSVVVVTLALGCLASDIYANASLCSDKNPLDTNLLQIVANHDIAFVAEAKSDMMTPEACEDTPGWDNNYGFTCASYAAWCENGDFKAGYEWTGSPSSYGAGPQYCGSLLTAELTNCAMVYNCPADNCCACGKRRLTNSTVCSASAMDDPHVTSLAGERFRIYAPSVYTLLRLPKSEEVPALLEVRANISEDPQSACKLYITSVEVSGQFMQGGVAQVLPLARDKPGGNAAGGATERFLTLVTSQAGEGARRTSISWERASEEWSTGHALSSKVTVRAETQRELKNLTEGQLFDFAVGPGAHVFVQQALHQALNVRVAGAGSLGARELGGLLGTGKHSPAVEDRTEACLATHARRAAPLPLPLGETMIIRASW